MIFLHKVLEWHSMKTRKMTAQDTLVNLQMIYLTNLNLEIKEKSCITNRNSEVSFKILDNQEFSIRIK